MIADLQQQLGIDASFFWQFLNFFAIYLVLRVVFFSPFLKLIQQREGQSSGLSEEAKKLEEEATRLEAQYQESLSLARKKAYAERDALLTTARQESSGLVAAARERSKSRLEQARESASAAASAELASLKTQVSSVSALLAEKLAQTKVGI